MKPFLVFLLLALPLAAWGTEAEISAPETGIEREDSTSAQENEARGIIPRGGLTVSTRPITPISFIPEKKAYDQAMEELAMANDLWSKGKAEAASDVALQAYDDFMSLHMPRRDKKRRQQLRLDRRRAATVYIDSSLAYIRDFVKRNGSGEWAVKEGRARLGDLRDVALNYPELMKKVNLSLNDFNVTTSTNTAS